MGLGQVMHDLVGQRGERFPGGRGRSWTSVQIMVVRATTVAPLRPGYRRPIPAKDLGRPLKLPKFARIPARIRMVATGPLAVCIFDRSPRRPASTESRWMHANVLEAEDSEGRVDPFRLQVKLPQVGENPTGFVAAFDAVSFVVTRDCGPHPVVASTCETEEPLFHVPPSAHCLMAFRVSQAKVIRRPRLGVDCVVPGRALGVQGPGGTV